MNFNNVGSRILIEQNINNKKFDTKIKKYEEYNHSYNNININPI